MKTSNKILLSGILGIIIVLILFAIAFRMNAVPAKLTNSHHNTQNSLHNVIYDHHDSSHSPQDKTKYDKQLSKKIISKKDQQKTIAVKPFNAIEIIGKFNIFIKQSSNPQITIIGDKNIIPFIHSDINNGKLKIEAENNIPYHSFKNINIIIETNGKINEINLSGLNTLQAKDINTNHLSLNVIGKIPYCLLTGKVKKFNINAEGKFMIEAKNLEANNVKIVMTGKGDLSVNAKNKLSVTGFGSGMIRYYGKPKQVYRHIFGKVSIVEELTYSS